MPDMDFDIVIIGGGIVGLAIAAETAQRFRRVALLERHDGFGRETSSRNSEVIHGGIYYNTDSLKARLCVEGRRLIYAFAQEHGIPFKKSGKIIVAVNQDEVRSIEELKRRGEANGVENLTMLTAAEVRRREPNVRALAALLSPETGIVDSHRLMEAYCRVARNAGADIVFGANVEGLEQISRGWEVRYRDSAGVGSATTRAVVNSAGLGAQAVMRMAMLDPDRMNLRLHLCKGEYFSVIGAKRTMVKGLVYPSPRADLVSLGIHTRVDLGGSLRLGPSAFYVDEIDYSVDASNAAAFAKCVKPFLPFIEPEDLAPDMSGIRPKLAGPGQPPRDFHIAHEAANGTPGFFNLVGIESPGLTASPALARYLTAMIADYLG
jgi:L-2-hydroxyglutarate oxidase LhgO